MGIFPTSISFKLTPPKIPIYLVVIGILCIWIINACLWHSCVNISLEEGFTLISNLDDFVQKHDTISGLLQSILRSKETFDRRSRRNEDEDEDEDEDEEEDPKDDTKEGFVAEINHSAKIPQTSKLDPYMSFGFLKKYDTKCCPSNLMSSTGCICLNEEQRKYLLSRGGNRTYFPGQKWDDNI